MPVQPGQRGTVRFAAVAVTGFTKEEMWHEQANAVRVARALSAARSDAAIHVPSNRR